MVGGGGFVGMVGGIAGSVGFAHDPAGSFRAWRSYLVYNVFFSFSFNCVSYGKGRCASIIGVVMLSSAVFKFLTMLTPNVVIVDRAVSCVASFSVNSCSFSDSRSASRRTISVEVTVTVVSGAGLF